MTNILYAQEFLGTVRDDITPLLRRHWSEVALNKDQIPLDPDWDAYEELERGGMLRIFTARVDGQLVAYYVVIVRPHLHYRTTLCAFSDLIYVEPEERCRGVATALVGFSELCLREDGVRLIVANTKVRHDFGPLLSSWGYEVRETVYSKMLE